jgi:hypothetical protein
MGLKLMQNHVAEFRRYHVDHACCQPITLPMFSKILMKGSFK